MAIETVVPVGILLVALGAIALGGRTVLAGATTVQARLRSGRTEPKPVREISTGGYVEAVGAVDALTTEAVVAPFSGTECAVYEYRLQQKDGSEWQVAEGSATTTFVIEDDTGASVEVVPDGGSPNADWETVATVDAGERLPEDARATLREHPDVDTDARPEYFASETDSPRRYEERRIDLGDEAYAYGNCTSGGVHQGRIDAANSGNFAVGTEPAGSFGGGYLRAVVRLVVGVVLVGAGLYGGAVALTGLGVALPVEVPRVSALAVGLPVATYATVGSMAVPPTGGLFEGPTAVADHLFAVPATSGLGASAPIAIAAGLLFLLPGGLLAWKGLSSVVAAARIYLNQPVNPGEAAMLDGIVELEGTVAAADDGTLESPFGGEEAVLSQFRVRQQETERRRYTDSDGNRRTRRKKVWKTKATGSFGRNFLVESEGSEIEVDPSGADLTLGEYETIHSRSNDDYLPQSTRLRLSAGEKRGAHDPSRFLSQNATKPRRFQERTLAPGDSVHLYGGEIEDKSAPDPVVVDGGEEYSIALGTELRTVLRRGGAGLFAVLFAVPFLGVGAFLLIGGVTALL